MISSSPNQKIGIGLAPKGKGRGKMVEYRILVYRRKDADLGGQTIG